MASVRTLLISIAILAIANQVDAGLWDDIKNTFVDGFNSAWEKVSDAETWKSVSEKIKEAGGDAVEWSKEAWVSSKEGADCLKEALDKTNTTAAVLDCKAHLGGKTGGTNVATFNTFLGAGIAIFIFARAA